MSGLSARPPATRDPARAPTVTACDCGAAIPGVTGDRVACPDCGGAVTL